MDKQRKNYYDFYTGRSWGKPHNYDFCINSSNFDLNNLAEILRTLTFDMECVKNAE